MSITRRTLLHTLGVAGASALLPRRLRAERRADAESGFDTTVDWTLPGGETVPRFYHIYAPAEFRRELDGSGLEIVDFEISSGNCYVVVSAA